MGHANFAEKFQRGAVGPTVAGGGQFATAIEGEDGWRLKGRRERRAGRVREVVLHVVPTIGAIVAGTEESLLQMVRHAVGEMPGGVEDRAQNKGSHTDCPGGGGGSGPRAAGAATR